MTMKDKCAVVGVGATDYYRRGQSVPQTTMEMAIKATKAALDDAGLVAAGRRRVCLVLDGPDRSRRHGQGDGRRRGRVRGHLDLRWGRGGGVGGLGRGGDRGRHGRGGGQPDDPPTGGHALRGDVERPPAVWAHRGGGAYGGALTVPPETAFTAPAGMGSPGHNFSMLTQRHMHDYGTTREHLAEICISQRNNALNRPKSLFKTPLTHEDYFNARMISDPLCLFDYTMESDGAVAVITTSTERAKDLRQPPAIIAGSVGGGHTDDYSLLGWWQQPADLFASSGHRAVAKRLYAMAGVGPQDIDVACLYDHFSPMVLMQVEDYGFCPIGEGGPFIADGNIRLGGSIPVNTHGGNLSEAYIIGMTHLVEAVEQVRGTAINQVADCAYSLCTGGPATIPMSGTIFRKA